MCEDCGYACHYKCMASIARECAHVVACERGQYEHNICPEVGMSAQKYQCAECQSNLIVGEYLSFLVSSVSFQNNIQNYDFYKTIELN